MITAIFKGRSFCGFFAEDDLAGKIYVHMAQQECVKYHRMNRGAFYWKVTFEYSKWDLIFLSVNKSCP